MPDYFNSPAVVQESASANHENATAQHAYRLISQLRYHIIKRPTLPNEVPTSIEDQVPERESRSDCAAGF